MRKTSQAKNIKASYFGPTSAQNRERMNSTQTSGPTLKANHDTHRSSRLLRTARVAGQRRTSLGSLDAGEALELALAHLDALVSEARTVSSTLEEADTVGVHRLVDGSSARSGAGKRNLSTGGLGSLGSLALATVAESLDDGGLHRELDPVQGEEPDDVPDPDDTDPASGDGVDISEAPVGVRGNDGRDELSNGKGTEEGSGRALHEEEAVRASDEDERLGDHGNLEVDNHVQLAIVVVPASLSVRRVLERDTELVLEEVGLEDDDNEDDGGQGKVKTVCDSEGEDLSQVPSVGGVGRQDTIDRERHDGTVVQERDDKNHERREVELVGKREDGEADNDTDGDGAGVDGIVAHTLEDLTRALDSVDTVN